MRGAAFVAVAWIHSSPRQRATPQRPPPLTEAGHDAAEATERVLSVRLHDGAPHDGNDELLQLHLHSTGTRGVTGRVIASAPPSPQQYKPLLTRKKMANEMAKMTPHSLPVMGSQTLSASLLSHEKKRLISCTRTRERRRGHSPLRSPHIIARDAPSRAR